eukprot:scaffold362737_cov28-Attheya_sp.AAC.1
MMTTASVSYAGRLKRTSYDLCFGQMTPLYSLYFHRFPRQLHPQSPEAQRHKGPCVLAHGCFRQL